MGALWRKSSYSTGNGDNCIEVATNDTVLVRDTMNRDGFTLSVSASTWRAFLNGLRVG